ncbi:hypothetical protein [Paenibacillus sp. NEAU-GSW1]|uniref:hypothetical protein n=1 Tax=Paenibacillus sp. NEAU-GSW1 TaxID=2682486 RepID=UPI0012E1DB96|nr:hypothetical protein [Paenibacillus sp. NEAU-GSW1]MUT65199.1 hypothetical protein [Paenibacillus sp. NEAU-GSW1]
MQEQRQKKLLILEDDEAIREVLTYALKGEGYQVFGAGTGKGARARRRMSNRALPIHLKITVGFVFILALLNLNVDFVSEENRLPKKTAMWS